MNRLAVAVLLLLALLGVASCGEDVVVISEIDNVSRAPKAPAWAKVAPEQIAEAKKHGVPVAFENEMGMRFVLIPAGTFLMGSERSGGDVYDYATRHSVVLSKPYYFQVTEVTNKAYRRRRPAFRNRGSKRLRRAGLDGPSHGTDGDERPVSMVTHQDAIRFATWLTAWDSQRRYRLPTEAEWENACRAGTSGKFYCEEGDIDAHENVADVALGRAVGDNRAWHDRWWRPGDPRAWDRFDDGFVMTAPVGSFLPNPWGLHDMHGNVSEWCADWYGVYPTGKVTDPAGVTERESIRPRFPWIDRGGPPPLEGLPILADGSEPKPRRVVRGGGWNGFAYSGSRGCNWPERGDAFIGFRLVSPLPENGR